MIKHLKFFGRLIKQAFTKWKERDPFNNSILIAYYTIFSLPGLLVIIINVGGYFYDQKQVTTKLTDQIQATIGGDTAKDIEAIIEKASESKGTVFHPYRNCNTSFLVATGVFYQVQQMLNKLGGKPKGKNKAKDSELLRDRSFHWVDSGNWVYSWYRSPYRLH